MTLQALDTRGLKQFFDNGFTDGGVNTAYLSGFKVRILLAMGLTTDVLSDDAFAPLVLILKLDNHHDGDATTQAFFEYLPSKES
jgi:hypothetical protein